MSTEDLDTLFHCLYYGRRILQALAALAGDDDFCDLACVLDKLASVAWGAAR